MADTTDTETLEDLRSLHRAGTRASTHQLATLFELMARGQWAESRRRRGPLWVYDRHGGRCASCSCPPRSAAACAGPHCEATIISVHDQPRAYCSGACRGAAARFERERAEVVLWRALREHRAGLEEDELARRLGMSVREVRAAEERINRTGRRIRRTQREDPGKFGGISWYLTLA